jgi:hypothetical protein
MCAEFISSAVGQPEDSDGSHPTGFDPFERALVAGAANIL